MLLQCLIVFGLVADAMAVSDTFYITPGNTNVAGISFEVKAQRKTPDHVSFVIKITEDGAHFNKHTSFLLQRVIETKDSTGRIMSMINSGPATVLQPENHGKSVNCTFDVPEASELTFVFSNFANGHPVVADYRIKIKDFMPR